MFSLLLYNFVIFCHHFPQLKKKTMREFATTQGAVQVSKRPGRRQLGRVEAWRQVVWRKYGKSLGKHLEIHGKSMGNPWEIHGKSTMNGSFRGKIIERNGEMFLQALFDCQRVLWQCREFQNSRHRFPTKKQLTCAACF